VDELTAEFKVNFCDMQQHIFKQISYVHVQISLPLLHKKGDA